MNRARVKVSVRVKVKVRATGTATATARVMFRVWARARLKVRVRARARAMASTGRVEARGLVEAARAHAGEARLVHPASRLGKEDARVDRARVVGLADDDCARLEESGCGRVKVHAEEALFNSTRRARARGVEVDIDVGVQQQLQVAQREDRPLEQRAVLQVFPAALDPHALEVRLVRPGGDVTPDVVRVALTRRLGRHHHQLCSPGRRDLGRQPARLLAPERQRTLVAV